MVIKIYNLMPIATIFIWFNYGFIKYIFKIEFDKLYIVTIKQVTIINVNSFLDTFIELWPL